MYQFKRHSELHVGAEKVLRVTAEDLEQVLKPEISPKALQEILLNIYDWYDKQEHLPKGELHDQVIIRHIVTSSYRLEKVKEKIDNYYTVRRKMPEILTFRDPKGLNLDKYLRQGFWIILPQRTLDKHRVTMFRVKNSENINIPDLVKLVTMLADYRMYNDAALAEHWIFDFKNTTTQQALQLTPMLIKKIIFYVTKCLGPKIKGLHLVNVPPFADTLLTIFKNTMKSKLVKRIVIYNNIEDLLNEFPKEIIPKDLGGEDISCDEIAEMWLEAIQSPPWRKFFIEQDQVKTDESKRREKCNFDSIFGAEGSFTNLEVD